MIQSQRVWANSRVSFQLTGTAITCSVHQQDQDKTVLRQKIYCFQTLPKEVQFLFEQIDQFWHYVKNICKNKPNQITLSDLDSICINIEVVVAQKVITRKVKLMLDNYISAKEEIKLLRNKIDFYARQLQQFKEQIKDVKRQNMELRMIIRRLDELGNQTKTNKSIEVVKNEQASKIQQNINKDTKQTTQKFKESQSKNTKSLSKQFVQSIDNPTLLPMIIDEQCMYYNKFSISKQQITSLYEDYYQLYFRDPLPTDSHLQLRIKMLGKNHCSFGIFCSSQKNNQYSFQNNKSVCFYTYYEGNFQGIYNRGKYLPLAWKISKGFTTTVDIKMKEHIIAFWIQGQEEAAQLDFSALLSEGQDLFFFIEMYQKGNCVQFQ